MARALVSIANLQLWLAGGLVALACSGLAGAQAYTPPPPPLQFGPCKPTKEFPCDAAKNATPVPATTNKFPFPGEAPAPATSPTASSPNGTTPSPAQPFPFPGEPPTSPATPSPASGQKPVDSKQFPFPGEPVGDAPSSSSSSSSSSTSDGSGDPSAVDPDKAGLKDAGSTGSTRFERKKLAVPEDTSKRELDDLDVSHYYITTGDFVGAYARAQDAVKLYPDDEQAHFALGLSADKLKKKDEAIAEYSLYLKMAPDGPKAKQVERALETLGAK